MPNMNSAYMNEDNKVPGSMSKQRMSFEDGPAKSTAYGNVKPQPVTDRPVYQPYGEQVNRNMPFKPVRNIYQGL